MDATTEYINGFGRKLTDRLLEQCTEDGYLEGVLLNSPDIDDKWDDLAPEFYGESIREFNSYPDAVLGWAAFLGMAVAHCWDGDWTRLKDKPYSFYQGPDGFDYMDEHILRNILGLDPGSEDEEDVLDVVRGCAETANTLLRRESVEAMTPDAYKAVLKAIEVMYRIGAALELSALGYHFSHISPDSRYLS